MMRQDAGMDHVGIGEHHVRSPPNRPPRVLRRITVVGEHANIERGRLRELVGESVQLHQLILRERLRREEIQGSRGRVRQNGVEHRGVVAERLARRRGRRHDDVAPGERVRDRGRLVRVQTVDPAC
jgi:hypothetical protein